MDIVIEELSVREAELKEYLNLLEFLESSTQLKREDGQEFAVTTLLIKTLKGAVFVVLYNLIESTMREAIASIHDSIGADQCGYENIRVSLQKEVWRRAKSNHIILNDLVTETSTDISKNMHLATFIPEKLFSGNIARSEVKKLAEIYGFSESTNYSKTGHGNNLSVIKGYRNDLAHGNKTFSEIGSLNSIADVKQHSKHVVEYLYEIVDNIMDCVDQKLYT